MDKAKQAKLEAAGWVVGTPNEFLNVSGEDDTSAALGPQDENGGEWKASDRP